MLIPSTSVTVEELALSKKRVPRRRQDWRKVIRDWQKSSMKISEYCKKYHVSTSSFYLWKKRLESCTSFSSKALKNNFIPVCVKEKPVVPKPLPGLSLKLCLNNTWHIEFSVSNGWEDFKSVLQLLKEVGC